VVDLPAALCHFGSMTGEVQDHYSLSPVQANARSRAKPNRHMKPTIRNAAFAAFVVLAVIPSSAACAAELKTEAEQAIDAFNKADSSLKKLFDDCPGYAIFPSVGKGGLIIGGEHGKGMF